MQHLKFVKILDMLMSLPLTLGGVAGGLILVAMGYFDITDGEIVGGVIAALAGMVLGLGLVILGALYWATGSRIVQGRWRMMQTLLALPQLLNIPIGTAVGGYILWAIWGNAEAKRLFAGDDEDDDGDEAHDGGTPVMGTPAVQAPVEEAATAAEPVTPPEAAATPTPAPAPAAAQPASAPAAAPATAAPLPLAIRLKLYLQLFRARPDVTFLDLEVGEGAPEDDLADLGTRLPAWMVDFVRHASWLEFTWVFTDQAGTVDQHARGYNGGRMKIPYFSAAHFQWYPHGGWEPRQFTGSCMIDEMVDEGCGWLVYEQAPTDALITFHNASQGQCFDMGDMEAYLGRGARWGFAWYWQTPGAETEAFAQRLYAGSLPRETPPAQVRAALEGRGLTPDQAQSMMDWLGEDVVILLPTS